MGFCAWLLHLQSILFKCFVESSWRIKYMVWPIFKLNEAEEFKWQGSGAGNAGTCTQLQYSMVSMGMIFFKRRYLRNHSILLINIQLCCFSASKNCTFFQSGNTIHGHFFGMSSTCFCITSVTALCSQREARQCSFKNNASWHNRFILYNGMNCYYSDANQDAVLCLFTLHTHGHSGSAVAGGIASLREHQVPLAAIHGPSQPLEDRQS